MEFTAVRDGKVVRADFKSLADTGMQEGERFAGIGSAPYEAVYADEKRGVSRTVDLRQLASASGLEGVDFKFDRDKAIEMGVMSKDAKVDQGDVYNLERIKTEQGRMKYLQDKGFAGVIKDGDAYYATKNGSVVPINQTVGIGIDDVTRVIAHAGRDAGSVAAATATVGAGVATGGAALAAGGAAAAAGGMAGEAVQRGVDKLVGAGAAKYNAQMSGSEEAIGAAKDAGMGALNFVGGQLAGRGLMLGKEVAAAGLNKVAGAAQKAGANAAAEWAEGTAAKASLSALEQRLPGGAFSRFATEEQAAAQQLISQASQKGVSTGSKKEAVDLASGALRGTAKEKAGTEAEQAAMREAHEGLARQMVAEQTTSATKEQALKTGRSEAMVELEERMKDKARDIFPKHAEQLDEIFKEKGTAQAASAARAKFEDATVGAFAKENGLKLSRGPNGEIGGIDQDSMAGFLTKKVESTMADAEDFIRSAKTKIAPGEVVPPSAVKQEVTSSLNKLVGTEKDALSGDFRAQVKTFVSAVNKHSDDPGSQNALRDAAGTLEDAIRAEYGKGVNMSRANSAIEKIEEQVARYQASATKNVEGLESVMNIQKEYMGLKKMRTDGVFDADEGTAVFMNRLKNLSVLTGDDRAEAATHAITALDMEATLSGRSSKVRHLLDAGQREYAETLQFVRLNTIEKAGGEAAKESALSEHQKRSRVAGVVGAEELIRTRDVSHSMSAAAGAYALGSGVGGGMEIGGMASKAKAAAQVAKGAGAKVAATSGAALRNSTVLGAGAEEYAMRNKRDDAREPQRQRTSAGARVVNR